MKVFIKSLNLCDSSHNNYSVNVIKVYFQAPKHANSFLFETIDYPIDKIFDSTFLSHKSEEDLLEIVIKYIYDNVNIIHYSQDKIFFSSYSNSKIVSDQTIDIFYLCRGIDILLYKGDDSFLIQHLKSAYPVPISVEPVNCKLPSLKQYIQDNQSEFKVIYYPGAGFDFSPLQIFGTYGSPDHIYFVDFNPDLNKDILERFVNRSNAVYDIFPEDFNKNSWEYFWRYDLEMPYEYAQFFNYSQGKKVFFPRNSEEDSEFIFYYLQTEGIQTASVLLENNIFPDVIVLQDHGFTMFSGSNSRFYLAMLAHLPKYILINPNESGSTEIWPGYIQVTNSYVPDIHESIPQNQTPRALFKKIV